MRVTRARDVDRRVRGTRDDIDRVPATRREKSGPRQQHSGGGVECWEVWEFLRDRVRVGRGAE